MIRSYCIKYITFLFKRKLIHACFKHLNSININSNSSRESPFSLVYTISHKNILTIYRSSASYITSPKPRAHNRKSYSVTSNHPCLFFHDLFFDIHVCTNSNRADTHTRRVIELSFDRYMLHTLMFLNLTWTH